MKKAVLAGHDQRLFEIKVISALHTALYDEDCIPPTSATLIPTPELSEFLNRTSETEALANQKFRMIRKIASDPTFIKFNHGEIRFRGTRGSE